MQILKKEENTGYTITYNHNLHHHDMKLYFIKYISVNYVLKIIC